MAQIRFESMEIDYDQAKDAINRRKHGLPLGTADRLNGTWPGLKRTNTTIPVHIRLSADVLAAFKASGEGWQARMNALLRAALAEGKV